MESWRHRKWGRVNTTKEAGRGYIRVVETKVDLLQNWVKEASVMHIAHLKSAARCAKLHRLFGCSVAGMTTLVGTSVFASLQTVTSARIVVATGFVSILAATLTGIHTFLSLDKRASEHIQAGAHFQGLRRELEEELVLLREGNSRDNFESIRRNWCEILRSSPPLPQRIHDKVKRMIMQEGNIDKATFVQGRLRAEDLS